VIAAGRSAAASGLAAAFSVEAGAFSGGTLAVFFSAVLQPGLSASKGQGTEIPNKLRMLGFIVVPYQQDQPSAKTGSGVRYGLSLPT